MSVPIVFVKNTEKIITLEHIAFILELDVTIILHVCN